MIDIETGKERDLKNIRQIGTPTENDRIYIENAAYARIHEEDYAERRVFIFMGHTECAEGKYTTFVEAAIPVRDLEFTQNVPRWSNHAWSDVFREIKRSYENSIIVGWALDIKGFTPRMTPELEAVHREQFGGAHQVLFLMDSIEGEEFFYLNKGNRLQQKEGFYIYYARELHKVRAPEVKVELPKRDYLQLVPKADDEVKGRYRESMQQKEANTGGHKASSYAMAAAIALLVVIAGAGVVQGRVHVPGFEKIVSTMTGAKNGGQDKAEVLVGTELKEQSSQVPEETQTLTETLDLIPIEEIPAGEVKKQEESQMAEETQSTDTAEDTQAADNQSSKEKTSQTTEKTEETANTDVTTQPQYYTVQEGDTLTGICRKIYGSTQNLEKLASANQLENQDEIHVGQKLLLP